MPERTTPGLALVLPLLTIRLLRTAKAPPTRLMPPPLFVVMTLASSVTEHAVLSPSSCQLR